MKDINKRRKKNIWSNLIVISLIVILSSCYKVNAEVETYDITDNLYSIESWGTTEIWEFPGQPSRPTPLVETIDRENNPYYVLGRNTNGEIVKRVTGVRYTDNIEELRFEFNSRSKLQEMIKTSKEESVTGNHYNIKMTIYFNTDDVYNASTLVDRNIDMELWYLEENTWHWLKIFKNSVITGPGDRNGEWVEFSFRIEQSTQNKIPEYNNNMFYVRVRTRGNYMTGVNNYQIDKIEFTGDTKNKIVNPTEDLIDDDIDIRETITELLRTIKKVINELIQFIVNIPEYIEIIENILLAIPSPYGTMIRVIVYAIVGIFIWRLLRG